MNFFEKFLSDEFPECTDEILNEEEVQICSTSDDLTQLGKGVYILKKGIEKQKKAIILNLKQYMIENDSNLEFFPLVMVIKQLLFIHQNFIETQDDEFQIETLEAFAQVFQSNAWYKWLDILVEVIPHCSLTIVRKQYEELSLHELLKKSAKMRVRGVEILFRFLHGALIQKKEKGQNFSSKDEEVLQYFFNMSMNLYQDNQWSVRSVCAEYTEILSDYFSLEEIKDTLVQEIKELMEDEDIIVKTNTLITTFKIMFKREIGYFDQLTFNKMINKNYPEILQRVYEDDSSLVKLSKEIGLILYCFQKFYPTTFAQHQQISATFVRELIEKEDDYLLQFNAAYNFPAFCSVFNNQYLNCAEIYLRFSLNDDLMSTQSSQSPSTAPTTPTNNPIHLIQETFLMLGKQKSNSVDENKIDVLRQMVISFHEGAKILSKDTSQKSTLFKAFIQFMKNYNVIDCILPYMGEIAMLVVNKSNSKEVEQLVEVVNETFQKVHEQIKNWRLAQVFFQQLYTCASLFNSKKLSQKYSYILFQLLSDNSQNEALKPSISLLLAYLLYNNYKFKEKNQLLDQIFTLHKSQSFTQRKAFLTFCQMGLKNNIFSKSFFIQHFYHKIMKHQNEKSSSMKIKFCELCELIIIKILNKDDINETVEIVQALDKLKNDKDIEVSNFAFDTDNRSILQYKETEEEYKKKLEEEERLENYEQKLFQMDIDEEDEERRQRIEEEQKFEFIREKYCRKKSQRQHSNNIKAVQTKQRLFKKNSFNPSLIKNRDSSLNKNLSSQKRNSTKEYRNGQEGGGSILSMAGANSFRIINATTNNQEINGLSSKQSVPYRKRT